MKTTRINQIASVCGILVIFLVLFYSRPARRFFIDPTIDLLYKLQESSDIRPLTYRLNAAATALVDMDNWASLKSGQYATIEMPKGKDFTIEALMTFLNAKAIKTWEIIPVEPSPTGPADFKIIIFAPSDRAPEIRDWMDSHPERADTKSQESAP